MLFVPHAGITLTNISITPPAVAGGAGKLIISGEAATREALRAYDLALSSLPFVSNVDLPISAYAQTSNILFSMTLTGTLTP